MLVGTTEAAKRLGISGARLRILLKEGRVRGAYKCGKLWMIPLYNGLPIIVKRKRGPQGKWNTTYIPAKSVIHVNRHKIDNNRHLMEKYPDLVKNNQDISNLAPVLSVKLRQTNHYGHEMQVNGPCWVVYRPDCPRGCGATVWIETFASVDVINHQL
ncbi:MAG: hypothetical protein QNJ33_11640 [Crocosphaera sp.]|nr:hypothetical protein [Crocosphaera sp.]